MKKQIWSIVALVVATSINTYASANLNWHSADANILNNTTVDVVDRFGNTVTPAENWVIQLLSAANNAVIFTEPSIGFGWQNGNVDGQFQDNLILDEAYNPNNTPGAPQVYTRIYNASTVGAATWYAQTAPTTLSWSYDTTAKPPAAPTSADYNFGTVTAGQWVAVPEPSTFALLAAGLAVIGLRRKMRA